MIGIYKITNPNGRVYIGQSRNIEKRFLRYKYHDCKSQTRLHRSLLKYNFSNHIFEIIEECDITQLNIRERYWQEYYDVLSNKGMNCFLTETDEKVRIFKFLKRNKKISDLSIKKLLSNEHKLKISDSMKGKIKSEESKKKTSDSMTGKKRGPYKKKEKL